MDLGIRGRTAIVCASSQGLGKACARALAEAGVSLVINGRHRTLLDQTAEEIRQATGAEVTPVVADVSTAEGQEALLAACPAPDILINNNGGPPFRDFRELDREAMLTGVTSAPVACRISSAARSSRGRLRPLMTNETPASASARAHASPSP